MYKDKLIFISEDYSAVGRMSLTAAEAVMSAFDFPVVGLPTQIFSTQTEGFGAPVALTVDEWQQQAFEHWKKAKITDFSSGLIGYIGKAEIAENLVNFINRHTFDRLVVDPVMGDQGSFYPGIFPEYASAIKRLGKNADVITPNLFELGTLIGHEVEDVDGAINELTASTNPNLRVVATGIVRDNQIGVLYLDDSVLRWVGSPRVAGHFYGTGDLFAALLTGYLTAGLPFNRSVELSQHGTYLAVVKTANQSESLRKFGMSLSATLADIISNMQREK